MSSTPPSKRNSVLMLASQFEQIQSRPVTPNSSILKGKKIPPIPPKPHNLALRHSRSQSGQLRLPKVEELSRDSSLSKSMENIRISRTGPEVRPRPLSMLKSPISPPAIIIEYVPEQDAAPEHDRESKNDSELERNQIIHELISTESSYCTDLQVLEDIYALKGKYILLQDWRTLFLHLSSVIKTSQDLIAAFKMYSIGEAFLQFMRPIQEVYCTYCKHNQDALEKVADYSLPSCSQPIKDFLDEARIEMKGRTNAWPVQRVLKYPLLLTRLLKSTPPTHPDFSKLVEAVEKINLVAEMINQVKKNKDIVERYVSGKTPVNVIHGFSKKWNRGTQLLKNATGVSDVSATLDEFFDALVVRFDQSLLQIAELEKSLQSWKKAVKQVMEVEVSFSSLLEECYKHDKTGLYATLSSLATLYHDSKTSIVSTTYKSIFVRLTALFKHLQTLADMFKHPSLIIKKRMSKALDYTRVISLKARSERVEAAEQESADAFVSINTQICEELPIFFNHVQTYIEIVMQEIINLQAAFYTEAHTTLLPLASFFLIDQPLDPTRILQDYVSGMGVGRPAEMSARLIALLLTWRKAVWGTGVYSLDAVDTRTSSLSRSHSRTPSLASSLVEVGSLIEFENVVTPNTEFSGSAVSFTPLNIRVPCFTVTAMFHFPPELPDELLLEVGDVISVTEGKTRNGSEEWWYAKSRRGEGYVPCSYCSPRV